MEKSVFTPAYAALLELLRQVRSEKGLTQAQLAERLRETQSFVSKCERGDHRLDVIELRLFCLALDISPVEFMQRLEEALTKAP